MDKVETSISLANHAELVHMDRVPQAPAEPLQRLADMPASFSGISWYANYPDHYAGDARTASIEKGLVLRCLTVDAPARFIKAVKEDTVTPALEKEFFEREAKIRG